MKPWSFNQPVLLNKTRNNRSVLVWTLVGATAFAGVWAFLAPLPETVVVQGKLQPSRPVQDIEASIDGVVSKIMVDEGDAVSEGEVLVRFDQREAQARLQAALQKKSQLQKQITINQIILGEDSASNLTPNQKQQLQTQQQQHEGENIAAIEALARSRARLNGLHQALSTAKNIAMRYDQLLQDGAASEMQLLRAQTQVDSYNNKIEAEEREAARLKARADATIAGNEAKLRRSIEANLRAITDLNKEIRSAEVLLSNIELRAPADGVAFDITVNPGSVVKSGSGEKPLLKIIPQGKLQAKIYIPNSAIGFIKKGQRADISFTSFPRGDYGFITATIDQIGSDALTAKEQVRVLGTEEAGLFFPAVLKLSRQTLQAGQRQVPLQPGMSLVADVHLRNRRFISSIAGGLDDRLRALERMR